MRKSVKFPIISSQFLIKWEFYPLRELRQKKLTKKGKLQRSNRSMVIEALNWVRGYSANYFPFVSHLENLKALQTLWRSWREQRAANWGRRGLEPSICDRKRSAGQERVWLPGFRNRNRALEHQCISHKPWQCNSREKESVRLIQYDENGLVPIISLMCHVYHPKTYLVS